MAISRLTSVPPATGSLITPQQDASQSLKAFGYPFWSSHSEDRQHPHTFSDFQAWFLVYSASTSSGFSRDSRMRGSLSELVLHKKCHQLLPKHFTQHNYPNMGLKTQLLFQVDLSMPLESIIKCQPSSACLFDGSLILVGEKIQGLISFFHF